MTKITNLNEILSDWAYRVDGGMPDATKLSHLVILEKTLIECGWNVAERYELIKNLQEAKSKPDSEREKLMKKVFKYKDKEGNDAEITVGGAIKKGEKHPAYKKAKEMLGGDGEKEKKRGDGDITKQKGGFDRKSAVNKGGDQQQEPIKKKEPTTIDKEMKDAPEIDVDKTTDTEVGAKVKPFVEKISKQITELVKKGKMEEAKVLAQNIIDKYHITKPLYLQPDKKGLGKIKIGTKYKNFMGAKNSPSKYQQKIIDAIQSSGAVIPMRKKGISATTLAPNQVHANFDKNGNPQFKKGNVKTVKNKEGKIIAKEIKISDRKFVLKVNPNDELSRLRLGTLPEGDVDFIDINSADTPEGRTECIVNATNNLVNTFSKIDENLTDDFNKDIAKQLKEKTLELQKLEKKKNNTENEEEIKSLQKEFYEKGLEILETTKIKNPTPKGVNEFNSMAAYISETIEAVGYLNRGIETYIPASGNFETNDVLPFVKGNPQPTIVSNDGMTADEMTMYLKNEDHLAPAGASVKFAGGGASQLLSKIEKSTFHDRDLTMTINGKERKGTKELLFGLTETYTKLFPDTGESPKPLSDGEIKEMMEESRKALYEFYPEMKDNPDAEKEMIDKIAGSVKKQLDRLNKDRVAKGEGYDNAVKRMELYHFTQFVNVTIHNHPERGIKGQAFGNSDYASKIVKGVTKIERVHSDGVNTLAYAGLDIDMGYTVSKTGKITPTNVYSSRLKHTNVTDKLIKKLINK